MRTRRRFGMAVLGLAALATLLGGAGGVKAAPINWGPATNITGDTDVSRAGTLLGAFNIGGPGVGSTTVNGVTFTGLGLSGTSVTSGNFTFSLPTGWTGNNNEGGSGSPPFSNLSASYQTLLNSQAGDFSTPATITISGLVPGHTYQFEWWNDVGSGFPAYVTTATAGNSVSLLSNTSGGAFGGLGQFAIGTFTADSTTETITFSGPVQDTLNGLEFREVTAVPEPTSLALLGLGGLGLAAWRRWRKPHTA